MLRQRQQKAGNVSGTISDRAGRMKISCKQIILESEFIKSKDVKIKLERLNISLSTVHNIIKRISESGEGSV